MTVSQPVKASTSTAATRRPDAAQPTPHRYRVWILRSIALLLAVLLGVYGLMAMDMGRVNSAPIFESGQQVLIQRQEMTQAVDAHLADDHTASAWRHSGIWMALMNKATNPQYTYGNDSYFTTSFAHYAQMPKGNMVILSLHNVLGGICMLFGALQFWPTFRRRYPRWHRGFGMTYMVAVQLAMIMAGTYLYITPIPVIYDSFSFYVGLWVLVFVVTGSLWMSIYHLTQGQIAQHQAYMAINFGALLTAPILRYDWILFGMVFPHSTMNTVNFLTAGILLPQSFITGYLLFCVTRGLQTARPVVSHRPQPVLATWQRALLGGLLLLIGAGVLTVVNHFLWAPGLAVLNQRLALVPAGLAALDHSVVVDGAALRQLFTVFTVVALLSGIGLVWSSFIATAQTVWQRRAALALILSSAGSGVILLVWGWQLGAPSKLTLAGGTHAVMYGVIILLFSGLLALALWRGRAALVKEWGLFLVASVMATPVFYWILALLASLPIPSDYILQGQVYRLAADAGPALLIAMLLYSVYSQATAEKFSR